MFSSSVYLSFLGIQQKKPIRDAAPVVQKPLDFGDLFQTTSLLKRVSKNLPLLPFIFDSRRLIRNCRRFVRKTSFKITNISIIIYCQPASLQYKIQNIYIACRVANNNKKRISLCRGSVNSVTSKLMLPIS